MGNLVLGRSKGPTKRARRALFGKFGMVRACPPGVTSLDQMLLGQVDVTKKCSVQTKNYQIIIRLLSQPKAIGIPFPKPEAVRIPLAQSEGIRVPFSQPEGIGISFA